MKRSYRHATVEVTLDDFDDEDILKAAAEINGGGEFKTLAEAAYIAIITKKPEDEQRICRQLIAEITGRVL